MIIGRCKMVLDATWSLQNKTHINFINICSWLLPKRYGVRYN